MKFFFATVPNRNYLRLLKEEGVKSILIAASSIRSFEQLRELVDMTEGMDIFLDSGVARLLWLSAEGDKDYGAELLDWYLRLIEFIRKELKGKIWGLANFDADNVLGKERIDELNEKVFFPLLDEGFRVIFGWHSVRPFEEIEEWVRRGVNYIGLSGFESGVEGRATIGFAPEYTSYLRELKVKVHMYGVFEPDFLLRFDFDSADSSTWSTPVRYGVLSIFVDNRFITLGGGEGKKVVRQKYRQLFVKYGVDPDKIVADDEEECLRLSVRSFLAMEEYLNRKNEVVPVSLDESEIKILEGVNVVDPTAVFLCDRCFLKQRCPFYREGERCKLKFRPDIKDSNDLKEMLMSVIKFQAERVVRALMFEAIDGGLPSEITGTEIDRFMEVLKTCKLILGAKEEVVIKAEGGKGIKLLQELFGIKKDESDSSDVRRDG
jgi:hypothetical protein